MRSRLIVIILFAAACIIAMPIEKPNGPWSEINKPPYPLPKVGPEELPDDYFDQFDNSEVLPEEVREFWREKWRVWRKAILQRLAEAKPDSPPPIFWVNQRRERLNNTLRNKVKASIAWRLDALQQLEQKIKKARKNKDRDIQRACRLRMEADECDSRVAEAEKNLEEWTKELEALQRNKDVLPPGLKSPPKDDSGQFKAIMTGGIANAIKGAENLFSHIINDVGLKLPNGPESGGWQHVPLFKPVSPVPGSLFWKA